MEPKPNALAEGDDAGVLRRATTERAGISVGRLPVHLLLVQGHAFKRAL